MKKQQDIFRPDPRHSDGYPALILTFSGGFFKITPFQRVAIFFSGNITGAFPGVKIPIPPTEWRRLYVYGTLAMEMGLSVGVATLVGYYLDGKFQTAPVLTLIFLGLGCLAGVFNFIRLWKLLKSKIGLNEPDGKN